MVGDGFQRDLVYVLRDVIMFTGSITVYFIAAGQAAALCTTEKNDSMDDSNHWYIY